MALPSPVPLLAATTSPASSPTDSDYAYRLLIHWGASDLVARTVQFLVVRPFEVLVIVALAYLVSRLGSRVARRGLRSVHDRVVARSESHRASPRVATLGSLVASAWRIAVWLIAALLILGTLGINLTPLIAGATVVGAALGFGAQTVVRDTLAGFFIIIEDQFGVGDVIQVGDVSGQVEEITLRTTRLRSVEGIVWYIANGEIRKVGNTTIQWSRALIDIVLPSGVEIDRAIEVMEDEATSFAAEPRWSPFCLAQPEVWGVESMDSTSSTLRIAVRTPVRENGRVARALRTRVNARLASEGLFAPTGTSG